LGRKYHCLDTGITGLVPKNTNKTFLKILHWPFFFEPNNTNNKKCGPVIDIYRIPNNAKRKITICKNKLQQTQFKEKRFRRRNWNNVVYLQYCLLRKNRKKVAGLIKTPTLNRISYHDSVPLKR
jgi:hypothetical protein